MKSYLVLLLLAFATSALAQDRYDAKCGGVGSDERDALARYAASANLTLELFVEKGGEYIADAQVTLRAASGAPYTLRAEGPICYLQVPPGRYRVEATFKGVTRGADATVAASGKRRVAIAFPKSVGDRETDTASPEEKAQAARKP
jgi:hypothetical protein